MGTTAIEFDSDQWGDVIFALRHSAASMLARSHEMEAAQLLSQAGLYRDQAARLVNLSDSIEMDAYQ